MNFRFLLILKICLTSFVCFSQTAISFDVGGDADKFYPVIFNDANWYLSKETEISIGRSSTHLNSSWRGSLISTFRFHTSKYGNGSNYINAFVRSTGTFIAGWRDATVSNDSGDMIIWLKGGGTTYQLSSLANINYTVYDGVQHELPYVEINGPQHSFKTSPDSYVSNYQQYLATELLVEGNIQTKGNLGIGTATPQSILNIKKTDIGTDFISIVRNSESANLDFVSAYNGSDDLQTGSFAYGVRPSDDSWQIWSKNGTAAWNNLFAVKPNGNVGIGTTNPLNGLHLFSLNNPTGGSLRLGNSGSEDAVMSFGWNGVSQDAFKVSKYAHNSTENPTDLLTINAVNGNMGVGTSTPDQKLTIKGGIGFDFNSADKKLYSSIDGMLEWMTHDAAEMHGFAVSHQNVRRVLLNTNGSSYFLGGNLGVGTSTPDQKLTIKGGIGFDFNSADKKLYSSIDGMLEWMTNDGAEMHGFAVSNQNVRRVLLNTNGSSYFLGGNLGVGTATPNEKLTVAGKISAQEIKVSTNAGADFVFEPGYKLPNLLSLEKFVKVNKHLPEIPTAKQMVSNGVELGELNIKLLQKVEELTLHLIEKDKAITELLKRMEAIEKKVK